jgi:FkbM family methyltransferase
MLNKIRTALCEPRMALAYAAYRSGIQRSVPTAFGGRLWANTFSELRTAQNLSLSGQELRLLDRIPENGIALDIGAHIGIWTVPMALHRPSARIFAFEGAPGTYRRLQTNVERNSLANIQTFHCAVSDTTGTILFQSPQNASVFGRISAHGNSRGRYDETQSNAVPCTTIAHFCAEHGISHIDFMKVDVEGAELNVLRGATPLLSERSIDVIWMEIDATNQRDFGHSLEAIADFLGTVRYGARRASAPSVVVDLRQEHENNMLIMPLPK